MGKILKMLGGGELERRSITPNMIWSDLCENIHLHYRNYRLDFSQAEWAHFRAAINMLGKTLEYKANEVQFEEGDPNFLIQITFDVPISNDSDYYPNRFCIELELDGTVHVHYRDLRLHLTLAEFKQIAAGFKLMAEHLECEPTDYFHVNEPTRRLVPITSVQPYDAGHRFMAMDQEHRDGIEYAKDLIRKGFKMRPILVDCKGIRKDGFKRYMAAYELGHPQIEVLIDPYAKQGGQNNQSMIDDISADPGHMGETMTWKGPKSEIEKWADKTGRKLMDAMAEGPMHPETWAEPVIAGPHNYGDLKKAIEEAQENDES